MTSFSDILNRPASEVKKPPPLPAGSYICLVDGLFKERDFNGTPIIEFNLKPVQAREDVNQTELAETGGLNRMLRHSIWLKNQAGDDTSYQLKRFLEDHLQISSAGKTLLQMAGECPGKQVLAVVKHTPSKDGTELFANVASTAQV